MLGRILSVIVLITTLGMLSPAGTATTQIQDSYYKRIPIATTPGHEEYPDIAYCPGSGEYLVVFNKGSIITGQRLSESGDLIGEPFQISAPTPSHQNMTVTSCVGGSEEYFIVAWQFNSDTGPIWIRVQAVYSSYQPEPGSQLFGGPIDIGQSWVIYIRPQLACSDTENHCLLLYIYAWGEDIDFAQRLQVSDSGVAVLGDEFTLQESEYVHFSNSVSWNSIDHNYLVAWQRRIEITNQFAIAYTHIYGDEQGPGMIEMQHEPAILFTPDEETMTCDISRIAFNPQTGKFMVAISISNIEYDENGEIIILRVDGTGTGLQGSPVRFSDLGGVDNPRLYTMDIWLISRSSAENQFMIAAVPSQYTPSDYMWLYLLPIKGIYDPDSPDQLDGSITLFRDAERLYPTGIGNPTNSRSILVVEEGTW